MIINRPYDFQASLSRIERSLALSHAKPVLSKTMMLEEELFETTPNQVYEGVVMCVRFEISGYNTKTFPDRLRFMQVLQCFTQESLAIIRGCKTVKDIIVCNNVIVAIFETPLTEDVGAVIDTMSQINSLRKIIIRKASLKLDDLCVYFGIDYGECEAYYLGEEFLDLSLNWRGMALQRAMMLTYRDPKAIMQMLVTQALYNNLKEEYRSFFKETKYGDVTIYECNLVNTVMQNWLIDNM